MGSGPPNSSDAFVKQRYECEIRLNKVDENLEAFVNKAACGACLMASLVCCCCGLCALSDSLQKLEDCVIIMNQLEVEMSTLEKIFEQQKAANDPEIANKETQLNQLRARYNGYHSHPEFQRGLVEHKEKLNTNLATAPKGNAEANANVDVSLNVNASASAEAK